MSEIKAPGFDLGRVLAMDSRAILVYPDVPIQKKELLIGEVWHIKCPIAVVGWKTEYVVCKPGYSYAATIFYQDVPADD